MINTRSDLREYIYAKLGSPLIQVEVTEQQLNYIIDEVVQQFSNFSYDGEKKVYLKFMCEGRGEYNVSSEINEISQINQSGLFYSGYDMNGYIDQNLSNFILNSSGASLSYLITLSSTRSLTAKFFGNSVNFEFNEHEHKLYIYQDFYGPLLIECYMRYIPNEQDKIYNHEWIKGMCVAKAKLQWANNIGKYSQAVISGATINYDNIRAEGNEEMQKYNEELLSKWTNPAPFFIA